MRCCTVCCTRCCYLPVLVTPLTPLRLLCRPPPCRGLGNLHFRFYRTHTGSSNTHTHTHTQLLCNSLCRFCFCLSLNLQVATATLSLHFLPFALWFVSWLYCPHLCCPLGVCYKKRQQEQQTAANTEAAVKLRRDRGGPAFCHYA